MFERQIAFLARCYRCISMDELLEAMLSGRPLPRNAAVVTFDDGYRDNYEVAYPILRRHRVPAIFYVATGALEGGEPLWPSEARYLVHAGGSRITGPFPDRPVRPQHAGPPGAGRPGAEAVAGRPADPGAAGRHARDAAPRRRGPWPCSATGMMTWAQVREMRKGGMLFGAHTVTHPLLPSIPLARGARGDRRVQAGAGGGAGREPRGISPIRIPDRASTGARP